MSHAFDKRPLQERLHARASKYEDCTTEPLATDLALHKESAAAITLLIAENNALSKNVIEMTREDFDLTLNNLRRMGASIDGDNTYKRDLIDAITGTLAFGAQDRCPPPEGHWAQQFWDMGREANATRQELSSALELVSSCLTSALTGGEVSAARAGTALITAAEVLAKQEF